MKQKHLDLVGHQKILLKTLKVFDEFCKKHSITYFLGYGTLIGVVRHKGFIPWDDDIDIVIPRPEYEKLEKIIETEEIPQGYHFDSLKERTYVYPFMKFCYSSSLAKEAKLCEKYNQSPIWLDLFPLDGVPEHTLKRTLLFKTNLFLRNFMFTAMVDLKQMRGLQKILTLCLRPLAQIITPHRIGVLINTLSQRYPYTSTGYVGNVVWCYVPYEAMNIDSFRDAIDGEFEDLVFPIPKEFDYILTQRFGSYMKLPPKEKQVGHLEETIIWEEKDT